MRSNRESGLFVSNLAFILLSALPATTAAQNVPKEGRYEYTSCWSGQNNLIEFSKTYTAYSYEMTGTTRSTTPGDIFDKNTYRCIGMNASFNGKNLGSAVCEVVDRDGDRRLSHFVTSADGKTIREHVAGTGKYDGLVLETQVKPLGPFPTIKVGTFQNCNMQSGTYKLR